MIENYCVECIGHVVSYFLFFYILNSPCACQELVEHFEHHSLNRHFPGMETTLETPYRTAIAARGATMVAGR